METWVHLEKVGTSLNAFINVQLWIYFIALYVNLVELSSDFLYIIPHLWILSNQRPKKEKKTTTMIDQAGCSCEVEKCGGFSLISVLSKCHVCFCFSTFLLYFFSFGNWHNPSQLWLLTPVSHQGGIQTLSISHSNSCIWQVPVWHPNAFQLSVKTPPCLLFIVDPRPTSSQPITTNTAPPLLLHILSPLLLSGLFFVRCHLTARLPRCGLRTSKIVVLCHRCVLVPKMCFSNG